MVARPTVVARTSIRSVKIALAIHPTRYRPAAPVMAVAILFTDDFNLGYGFRTRNRVRLSQDRHGGSSGHIKNGGSCENRCFDQCCPLYVPGSPRGFCPPNPKAVRGADQLDDATSSGISRSPFDIPRETWTARLFSKICGRGLGRSSGVTEANILDWTYSRENSARLLRRLILKANPIPTVRAHSALS
jgi:hypothetical protein